MELLAQDPMWIDWVLFKSYHDPFCEAKLVTFL